MQFDWNAYLFQIQEMMKMQDQKIARLEEEVTRLRIKVAELGDRPAIHVDKIEYKFDQLKVETLEGTLNIGLNPADAENLEALAVNHENPLTPFLFQDRELLVQQLVGDVSQYLEKERARLLKESAITKDSPINEQVAEFIIQDILRQLPHRASLYLDQTPIYDRTVERLPLITERVREKLIRDIDFAILKFINDNPRGPSVSE